ncbi:MAG: hypothetical protein HY783_10970, partial [Chloroflexi bacterium]|nr:hypothetical protein [Chloroflexota bacterium]
MMKLIATRAIALYRLHQDFFLLAILFASFRLFTIFLFRPGGLLADSSDYDYYRALGDLTNWGYYPFINLWTPYPPLFPWMVVTVYRLAINIPSWTDPRLWFNLLLGNTLLGFEVGNLVLIYALALRIYAPRR